MKKNILAVSISAAVLSLGLIGGAQAMTNIGGASATTLTLNGDGVGHMLLVPYFSAQAGNSTLISLVNTDLVHGKAVKVRFRGAANSDDLMDFQVFLSPGDVYALNVSQGADGLTFITVDTPDTTCTKPLKAGLNGSKFGTLRLDTTMSTAQRANGTREGYVEIFNMGDIPQTLGSNTAGVAGQLADYAPATRTFAAGVGAATNSAGIDTTVGATINPLFTAIKHGTTTKTAPCTGLAFTDLDSDATNSTNLAFSAGAAAATAPGIGGSGPNTPRSRGLLAPTTGLMANWTIINTTNAAAWSGQAVAIQATAGNVPAQGNVVYFSQTGVLTNTAGLAPAADLFTADPLLRTANVQRWNPTTNAYVVVAVPAVPSVNVDLPDMSTPYTIDAITTANIAAETAALAAGAAAVGAAAQVTAYDGSIQANAAGTISLYIRAASAAAALVVGQTNAGMSTAVQLVIQNTRPLVQANSLTASISAATALNEFFTDKTVLGTTDWVFAMPTRRYSTSFNYGATISAAEDGRRFSDVTDSVTFANAYFNNTNTLVSPAVATGTGANPGLSTNGNGRQICVSRATMIATITDREEAASPTVVVVSPIQPTPALMFCGETTVLSINNGGIIASGTGSLKASVAAQDRDVTYVNGYMTIATPSAGNARGLPVVGSSFVRAFANATTSFGAAYNHRFTR